MNKIDYIKQSFKMEQKIIDVVGTMFFKDKKLLVDKPRKRSTFQMIGGSIKE